MRNDARFPIPATPRRRLVVAAAAAGVPWAAGSAWAQTFPDRPVNIVVPAPPGGTTDLAARAIAEDLSKSLGVSVVVQNKAGANGVVAMQSVLGSKPDGYTLYMAFSGFHVVSPNLTKLPFDTLKDVQPVAMVYIAPEVMAVRSTLEEVKTFQDLLTYGKANPGKLKYASAGNGSIAHVGMEMLKGITGLDILHVPYRGTGPLLTDLLGGQVDMFLGSMPPFVPHLQSGRIRALLFTSSKRQPQFPDVPTSAELGLKGFTVASWFALYAHKDVPAPIVEQLTQAVRKVMEQPSFQKRASELGAEATYMGPAELARYGQSESDRWAAVIKSAGIKAE
jgi:tripartite-type tricarboxylate transporter receptor subunit TctC